MNDAQLRLEECPVHLGLGASAVAQPPFTGMAWYADYAERHGGDGAEGRLVSLHRFDTAWQTWEMHPAGEELVVCLEGEIALIQELPDGAEQTVTLGPGEYAINPRGTWHTADVKGEVRALFITAGLGTEVRAR